jgi:chromosome segregation ATPase
MAIESDRLATLEEKVNAAARRLARLRSDNEALTRRVRELEGQLAGEPGEESGAWSAERSEIRRRVELLTRRLEDLAATADSVEA